MIKSFISTSKKKAGFDSYRLYKIQPLDEMKVQSTQMLICMQGYQVLVYTS